MRFIGAFYMLSINISKDILFKISEHAKGAPKSRVIGILLGRLMNKTLTIEDAISGKMKICGGKVILHKDAIAKIIDDIINRRIDGNMVGWYHSHPGYGVFMSEVDIDTQKALNQFSPYILSIVYDPSNEEFGFFALNSKNDSVERIGDKNIKISAC